MAPISLRISTKGNESVAAPREINLWDSQNEGHRLSESELLQALGRGLSVLFGLDNLARLVVRLDETRCVACFCFRV